MKKWPAIPLAEAYWFQEGPGVRKWQFRNNGIKLLNVANITKDGALDLSKTDKYLSKEEVSEKYSHFLADAGDLVIASSGISFDDDGLLRTRGAFVDSKHLPLCINTSTIRFKPKDGISILAWLRYWLDSREFREQITRLVTGSAQQNFGPSHLRATKITLPPLAEQERIIRLLDETDELRKQRAHADRRAVAIIPALFHEMFGDPLANSHGWQRKELHQLGRVVTGSTPPSAKEGMFGGDIPFITPGDLERNTHETMRFVTEAGAAEVRTIRAGSTMVCCIGATIGKTDRTWKTSAFNQQINAVEWGNEINDEFGVECMKQCAKVVIQQGSQTALPILKKSLFEQIRIPVPPLALQKEFAQRVTEIRELEADQATSRTRLEALFQSMLYRAFNEEL